MSWKLAAMSWELAAMRDTVSRGDKILSCPFSKLKTCRHNRHAGPPPLLDARRLAYHARGLLDRRLHGDGRHGPFTEIGRYLQLPLDLS